MEPSERPNFCECCGLPPTDKRFKPLEWDENAKEWKCVICRAKNELPVTTATHWEK